MRKFVIIFFTAVAVTVALSLALLLIFRPNFSGEDSSALVAGRIENGYDYVGYLLSDKNKICAATLINKDTIVTAAHCVKFDAGSKFKFGLGKFTTIDSELITLKMVKYAPGYNPKTGDGPDLAMGKLDKEIDLKKYPEVAVPKEKCDSSIVAYGAGVKDKKSTVDMFKKKSGEGCVKSINNNFLIRFNDEVGMCYGDSGGPIFDDKGSDLLIGVLSGGLIEPELDSIRCDVGNTGLAVNTSNFTTFLGDVDFKDTNNGEIRALDQGEIQNLTSQLNKFISDSQAEDQITDNTSSTANTTVQDNTNLTLLILLGMGTLVVIVIFAINRIQHVLRS